MQRLRIRFGRGEETRYISHLDLMRLWQRAFNRANIALAYSEGFNPHPRMSLAAPLALGVTSEAELMDVVLTRWSSPSLHCRAETAASRGHRARPCHAHRPADTLAPVQVRFADYTVELPASAPRTAPGRHRRSPGKRNTALAAPRDTGPHKYDLRKLINDIWLEDDRPGCSVIGMRLQCDSSGSGRPEQVALALGFEGYPRSIHRTRLILEAK
jgi:radical SAM-linked protein